jgi:CheY-like chemotaxis protein
MMRRGRMKQLSRSPARGLRFYERLWTKILDGNILMEALNSVTEIRKLFAMEKRELNIMMIEDDPDIPKLAKLYLKPYKDAEFNLVWVETGEDALKFLQDSQNLDVILVDFQLPGMNGLETTRMIRERGIRLPIVFLTNAIDFKLAIEAMKLDVEDYLLKEEAITSILPSIILNVVERVKLREKLAEAEVNKVAQRERIDGIKSLIVTISHELNNPLAALKLAINVLQRKPVAPDIMSYLSIMKENTERIEGVVAKLRDLKGDKVTAYIGNIKMIDLSE